jgi:TetR/AcrR family transcriptional regulator, transcriptional repressor for nem operon
MARIIKESSVRRNEILDAAQQLIYTKGYEQMTIQDILDNLQISKGAFYHYFESKQALLEAMIERTQQAALDVLVPILDDPNLRSLEKLERYFDTVGRWKVAQKGYMLALLRTWYADDNAIVRQKQIISGIKWVTPILTGIIQQGISEGTMNTPFPDQAGEVVVSLVINLGDALGRVLFSLEPESDEALRSEYLQRIKDITAAYTDAIERVLGASRGSLVLIDAESLKNWVTP